MDRILMVKDFEGFKYLKVKLVPNSIIIDESVKLSKPSIIKGKRLSDSSLGSKYSYQILGFVNSSKEVDGSISYDSLIKRLKEED